MQSSVCRPLDDAELRRSRRPFRAAFRSRIRRCATSCATRSSSTRRSRFRGRRRSRFRKASANYARCSGARSCAPTIAFPRHGTAARRGLSGNRGSPRAALSAYVVCNDLDLSVSALRHDSFIVSPDGNLSLVATAHDVFEDWAMLQWLEEQYISGERSFKNYPSHRPIQP